MASEILRRIVVGEGECGKSFFHCKLYQAGGCQASVGFVGMYVKIYDIHCLLVSFPCEWKLLSDSGSDRSG